MTPKREERKWLEGWLALECLGVRGQESVKLLTLGWFLLFKPLINTSGADGKLKVFKIIP